ncbi:MAG: cupin domain-containing protein [Candidatus Zixiibacteriota bacterium]|nr:MAG: cupin domain-containing protein [candidate division Zixibacteria bacterium]
MAVIKYDEIEMSNVIMDGASNVFKAVVIGRGEGWDSHAMRLFRLGADGQTPEHQHDFEHVVYAVFGSGKLIIGDETHDLEKGDFAFVPPNATHQFRNPGDGDFEFICVVPDRGEY